VRVFVLQYFRDAATEVGHERANHGASCAVEDRESAPQAA
jgi:hypothetical protein